MPELETVDGFIVHHVEFTRGAWSSVEGITVWAPVASLLDPSKAHTIAHPRWPGTVRAGGQRKVSV